MTKHSSFLIGVCFALSPLVLTGETEFHVSINGLDSNSGAATQPFRTIACAKIAVRKLVSRGLEHDVAVIIRAGNYEPARTLVFGPLDSGTENYSVHYRAAPGEVVTISGGRRIRNWRTTDEGHWESELAEVKNRNWFFRQLVVDDRPAVRARWPNQDGRLQIATVDDEVKNFTFDKPLVGSDLANQNAELVVLQNWSVTRGLVTASDLNQISTATAMGWIGHGPATTASAGKTAFLEHGRAFLDQPGEWFLDRQTGVLTYIPRSNQDPKVAMVTAPVLNKLIEISGSVSQPVRNLKFEGLRFENCDFSLPEIGYNEIQAAHYGTRLNSRTYVQPVAIECVYAQGCVFEGCRFAHLKCSGIGLGQGCRDNIISRCTLEDIGGSGIVIGWRGKGDLEAGNEGTLDADWRNQSDAPKGNIVSNCLIRRCGSDSFGGVGVFVAFSKDSRISHNQIHDLPYTGISVGYRWNTSQTSQTGCIVENNHIYDVMQKLADGGGVYTLGYQPGTVIRGNHIHDVHRSKFTHGGAPNNGFFVDEGSKGFLFESNVIHSISGQPVRFNNCQQEWHDWKSNYFGDEAAKSKVAKQLIDMAGVQTVVPTQLPDDK